jgi:hypothetical protein
MKTTNAIYRRNLLERHPKRHAAITPHILFCITILALLTGCTIEFKPDKAPGGTTGNNRSVPTYPTYPTYSNPTGPVYPGQVNPGPFTPMDGGYGLGTQPVSTSSGNRPTGDGFTIKITSL